jgi:hypothetical protein
MGSLLRDIYQKIFKTFILVLTDGFLLSLPVFQNLILYIRKSRISFLVTYEYLACGGWVSADTIFIASWDSRESVYSLTKSTPNEFSPMLSQHSNFYSLYMDIWTHAHPARNEFYLWLSYRGNDFTADWVNAEAFYHWLSQCGNDFIADWANGEIQVEQKLTLHGRLRFFFCIQPSSLSLELGIFELRKGPI